MRQKRLEARIILHVIVNKTGAVELFEPHESRPWNPLIASVFYRRGMIETWGQGTLKMAAWAEEAGLPRPEILEIPDLSLPEQAIRLHKSESAIERAIRKLRESRRLERAGPAKGGSWQVLE